MNATTPEDSPSKPTAVVLIEDDHGIQAAIHDVLDLQGYDVIDELNVVQSLAILREGRAQCAIIDKDNHQLKDPDEIISLMCAAVPEVHLIVLAGEGSVNEALLHRTDVTVLIKPFDVKVLLAALPPAASLAKFQL